MLLSRTLSPLWSGIALATSLGALIGVSAAPAPSVSTGPDYVREVRPLLAARCYACHGAAKQQGGLRLHRRIDALTGGDGGPVIDPGHGAESRLVRYVEGKVTGHVMPPAGPRLTSTETETLRRWIDAGAQWPESADPLPAANSHWAFRPIANPPVPRVTSAPAITNPIDAFVRAKLEKRGLRPSPPADRVTLIRRLSLDLIGLPPTVEEVDAFLADPKPGAYERVVDRLLASPHYGERWGRFWLDQARYADSNGYTIDSPRQMWMYRDWVIQALNDDMPFDRFTIEQLAGDLLPNATRSQLIASGFHRNTLVNEEGGTDPEQFRVEAVVDRVATTGSVWLGLTVGCAQCHSHKFDPITQREYYQLFAFFNNQDEPTLDFPTPEQTKKRDAAKAVVDAAKKDLSAYQKLRKLTDDQANTASATDMELTRLQAKLKDATAELTEVQKLIPTALILRERPAPRPTFVHIRGDFLRKGIPVHAAVPSVLSPLTVPDRQPNRLDFARWLVDGKNPLTARVAVNRIWQQHFGRGLVETDNDFGTQGTPPDNAELLDWLATAFGQGLGSRVSGLGGNPGSGAAGSAIPDTLTPRPWSLKALHRLIVTSATYRQSSHYRAELAAVDPQNRMLGRQNRLRLEAEAVRDAALAASGLLSGKIGGPSVYPPQPAGTELLTQVNRAWKVSEGEDRYRRGLYTFHWRSNPYPLFATFDAPNGNTTCTRRMRSDTPTQALMLANDAALVEAAQALAARTLREAPTGDAERLRYAFRRCVGRQPTAREQSRLQAYLSTQQSLFAAATPAEAEAAAPKPRPEGIDAARAAGWTAVCRALLNLDEFITRE